MIRITRRVWYRLIGLTGASIALLVILILVNRPTRIQIDAEFSYYAPVPIIQLPQGLAIAESDRVKLYSWGGETDLRDKPRFLLDRRMYTDAYHSYSLQITQENQWWGFVKRPAHRKDYYDYQVIDSHQNEFHVEIKAFNAEVPSLSPNGAYLVHNLDGTARIKIHRIADKSHQIYEFRDNQLKAIREEDPPQAIQYYRTSHFLWLSPHRVAISLYDSIGVVDVPIGKVVWSQQFSGPLRGICDAYGKMGVLTRGILHLVDIRAGSIIRSTQVIDATQCIQYSPFNDRFILGVHNGVYPFLGETFDKFTMYTSDLEYIGLHRIFVGSPYAIYCDPHSTQIVCRTFDRLYLFNLK